MTKDKYANDKLKAIKNAVSDEEIINIINRLYEDGFNDGYNDAQN